MAQDILVVYRAEVSQLTRELNAVIEQQEEITKLEKQGSQEATKNLKAEETAARKRQQLLKLEEQELKKLQQLRKLAFDPKTIADYDKKIGQATNNIRLLGGQVKDSLGGVGSTIKNIGLQIAAGIGAAFTVDAVIRFGQASVQAFLEAESNAKRLEFAITQIAGASDEAFDRLIAQSEALQRVTTFSDDAIQQAQTVLANFNLTADQIEVLLPRIADFAAATGKSIQEAAQSVGQGLQGMGREFSRLGIQVDGTKTELENYNILLQGLSKFSGAAANDASTLTGQLKQLENQVDDLQEEVGEGLAPAWLKVKQAVFEATLAVIDFFGAGGNIKLAGIQRDIEESGTAVDEVTKKVEDQTKALIKAGFTQAEASRNAINDIRAEITERTRLRIEQLRAATNNSEASEQEIRLARLKLEGVRNELRAINDIAAAQARLTEQRTLELNANQLKVLSTERLNELLKANQQITNIIGRSNVQLIQAELAAREKASAKQDELNKKRAEEYAKMVAQIKALDAEITQAELDEQNKRDTNFLNSLEKRRQAIVTEAERIAELQRQAEEGSQRRFIEDESTGDLSSRLQTARALVEQNQVDLTESLKRLEAEFVNGSIQSFDEYTARKIIINNEFAENYKQILSDLGLSDDQFNQTRYQTWLETNQDILNASAQLLGEIAQLTSQFTAQRTAEINATREAELAAIDRNLEANEEALNKRQISEKQAEANRQRLDQERIESEKKADQEIRSLKRRQMQADKAAATAQIVINIAEGISKLIAETGIAGIALQSLLLAIQGVQLGIVASQPIPYAKGSKDTGREGHMARVGEQGEEIVYMPSHSKVLPARQTKTYGEVLDAMYDNKFEKYVMKRYVTPALQKQQQVYEDHKQETFVKNVSQSYMMQYTGLTATEMDMIRRKGQPISNADQIGHAVAEALRELLPKSDIYRR